jgi:hypothetical protein
VNTAAIEVAGRAARDEIFEAFKRYLARMIVQQPRVDPRLRTQVFVLMLENASEVLGGRNRPSDEEIAAFCVQDAGAQHVLRDLEAMVALLRVGEGL